MIEFPPDTRVSDLQSGITRDDLIRAANAMTDKLLELVRDLPDSFVTFEPLDPDAHDPYAADEADVDLAWTLGHVIVHVTASLEESAARGATLARGVAITGRSRYETPWQSVTTTAQLVERLEESRRMQLAFLNAWPDQPHLDNLYTEFEEHWGALNAVGMTLGGIRHASSHLGQIEEIIRQARAALA
jgi:hypothetical protein